MDFRLTVYLNESDSGTTHKLDNNYIVGRHSSCGIYVGCNVLSREHCTLILMPKAKHAKHPYYVIRDGVFAGNRSRNGTWVNGSRIEEITKLNHQDIITFGRNYPRAIFWESELENQHYSNDTFPTERE